MADKSERIMGLKKLRVGSEGSNATVAKPTVKCSNCGCVRYNLCTCAKRSA